MTTQDLGDLRRRLDAVDLRILDAIADRQRVVEEVARLKARTGTPLRDVLREQDLLTRLTELARERGLDGYFITRVFRDLLDYSIRYQQEHLADLQNPERTGQDLVKVAYQGTNGAYSQMAGEQHFAPRKLDVEYCGFRSFGAMLEAVQEGDADYGMLPVENTTAGSINEAYDLLNHTNLSVVGEEVLRVEHCLVGLEDAEIDDLRHVYSHPQALAQCSSFLLGLNNCVVEAFTDTAMSVEKVRDERSRTQAAIASERAAQLYGLKVLRRGIANQKDNYTRFMVVAREPVHYDERIPCKTSLIFATQHEEGALLSCLNVLAQHGLNLTKLESRPRPNVPFEYIFYLDFEGNARTDNVRKALEEVVPSTSFLKVLGSYPARTTRGSAPSEPRRAGMPAPQNGSRPDTGPALQQDAAFPRASRAGRADSLVKVGELLIGGDRPVVIAGPAWVESESQINACARAAKDAGADLLRGGCFSEQDGDRGLGERGLALLEAAGRAAGLPVMTSVHRPQDVAAAARHCDLLRIAGQDMQRSGLLDAVGRVDRPVLLERGNMASVEQWLAAAEHILGRGNQQLALCEGGVRTLESAENRTLDLAGIPILRDRTHLPILVDPSACWEPRFAEALARATIASGAHGLVIAIHPQPDNTKEPALSFEELSGVMARLLS